MRSATCCRTIRLVARGVVVNPDSVFCAQEEHFAFLRVSDNTRMRTTFYSSLARLVFIHDTDEVMSRRRAHQRGLL